MISSAPCKTATLAIIKNTQNTTFSDTLVPLIVSNSGAIHGRVPLIPPETRVACFIFDKPKSATCST